MDVAAALDTTEDVVEKIAMTDTNIVGLVFLLGPAVSIAKALSDFKGQHVALAKKIPSACYHLRNLWHFLAYARCLCLIEIPILMISSFLQSDKI